MKNISIKAAEDNLFVTLQDVKNQDLEYEITYQSCALDALMSRYDLLSFTSLKAILTIKPWRSNGLQVYGKISSEYTQKCVISLEPVEKHQTIDIEQNFSPGAKLQPGQEIEIDITEDTPYEMDGDQLDLSSFILEIFALELDLYPRVKDAEIDPEYQQSDQTTELKKPSPFAILKKLKDTN